ncbi:MAG: hypothetical protein QW695_02490 [Candidatus Bathyarchaeia archaeon]
MTYIELEYRCSGRYLDKLKSIIQSIDRRDVTIQPCISDEGYMVRYPPIEGIYELDFNTICKLIRALRIERTICSPTLKIGRVDDGSIALTFTYDGGLTIQRIKDLDKAIVYASRGYRVALLASRCKLCSFRVFECIMGLCGRCLKELKLYDKQWILSEELRKILLDISRIERLEDIETYLNDQLSKASRIIWFSDSMDDISIAIILVSIILSMTNMYPKMNCIEELRNMISYLNEICQYHDLKKILESIAKLYHSYCIR